MTAHADSPLTPPLSEVLVAFGVPALALVALVVWLVLRHRSRS